jgi:hypothetical protein
MGEGARIDSLDFTDEESRLIGKMLKAERTLPEDFFHVPAVQELACILGRYGAVMTAQDQAAIIACGALLARHGKREMMAEIEARMALARARNRPEQDENDTDLSK